MPIIFIDLHNLTYLNTNCQFFCFRYLSLGSVRHKEMSRKLHAMYQSVLKVEKVCYNIKVRGSEAAIWSSNDANEKDRDDDVDEGFANY